MDWPKDGAQTKRWLAKYGGEKLRGAAERYLTNPDPFLAGKQHPLGLFWSRLGTYLGNGDGQPRSAAATIRDRWRLVKRPKPGELVEI